MGLFSFLFRKGDNSKLIEALKSGAMLVDVRSPGEYSSGSIPGAINVPMETVISPWWYSAGAAYAAQR